MCGIVGIIDSSNGFDAYRIKRMTDCISHRGPDAEGFLFVGDSSIEALGDFRIPNCNPVYALGHRRLSIVDIGSGNQPMSNEDGSVWITYNGEIYNHVELRDELTEVGHVFRTSHSDTEVVVHCYEEWGISGFDRLNGIFAIGILDLNRKRLILARDHFGVKPIYYHFGKGRFIFSSEIKAILENDEIERKLNIDALNDYLSFRYVPAPRTTFEGIFKIEAGGYLEFDVISCKIKHMGRYASCNAVITTRKCFRELVDEYQEHLERALKRQLMSDVEIGVLLSGGIDSSVVCAIATRHLDYSVRTYTVGFKDFIEGNEFHEAHETAEYLGTRHTNIIIDRFDFIDALDEIAWFMDEPTATSSSIPLYYLTKVLKKEVKVILTGQGADEIVAGYPRHWGERLYSAGFKYLGGLRTFAEMIPRQERVKRAFRGFCEPDPFERLMSFYYLFNPDQKRRLLNRKCIGEKNGLLSRLFSEYSGNDNLGRMLYVDARAWLADDLLTYFDKATMINGVEARVPFLDKDLVYFVENIPGKFKLSWRLEGKFIHKKACKKWLPSFVLSRRKKSFETPIDKWFKKEMDGYVKNLLLHGKISRNLFNRSVLDDMIWQHQCGKENFQRHIFALLMLEKWAEAYNVTI